MCGRIIHSSAPLRYAIVDGMNVRDSRVHNYPPRWKAQSSRFPRSDPRLFNPRALGRAFRNEMRKRANRVPRYVLQLPAAASEENGPATT